MENAGKLLMAAGFVLAGLGLLLWLANGRGWFGWIGHLPGDIRIETRHGTFYFPAATCLLLSLLLSGIFALLRRPL